MTKMNKGITSKKRSGLDRVLTTSLTLGALFGTIGVINGAMTRSQRVQELKVSEQKRIAIEYTLPEEQKAPTYPQRFPFAKGSLDALVKTIDRTSDEWRVWNVLSEYNILAGAANASPDIGVRDLLAYLAQESGGQEIMKSNALGALGPFQLRPSKIDRSGNVRDVNHSFCVENAGFSKEFNTNDYTNMQSAARCATVLLQWQYERTPVSGALFEKFCEDEGVVSWRSNLSREEQTAVLWNGLGCARGSDAYFPKRITAWKERFDAVINHIEQGTLSDYFFEKKIPFEVHDGKLRRVDFWNVTSEQDAFDGLARYQTVFTSGDNWFNKGRIFHHITDGKYFPIDPVKAKSLSELASSNPELVFPGMAVEFTVYKR